MRHKNALSNLSGIGIRVMKRALLVLIGVGLAQASGAAEMTFQPNNTLSQTITSTSDSSSNIYSASSNAHIYSNEEITKAIDNLSAHAKAKEYRLSSLQDSRLEYVRKYDAPKDSLADKKKWAEQGNVEYQIEVGSIYYDGKGVRQDLVLSRKMFQKAARQGDARGQAALAIFYEDGLGGLKRNRSTAKEWYGKTCDQGFQAGCDEYRRLNERGY